MAEHRPRPGTYLHTTALAWLLVAVAATNFALGLTVGWAVFRG